MDSTRARAPNLLWICLPMLAVLAANSFFSEYDDEWDNILGGLRVAQGIPLYSGYFSHHFPLPYLISGLFHSAIAPNFVAFRILWAGALGLVSIALLSRFHSGEITHRSSVFGTIATIVILSPCAWMHMLHAENIIAFCVLTALLYLWEPLRHFSPRDAVVLGALPSIVVLCSLGFVFLAITLAALGLWIVMPRLEGRADALVGWLIGALFPIAAVGGYLLFNDALGEWATQAITFNQRYYFRFTGEVPQSPAALLLYTLLHAAHAVWTTVYSVFTSPAWWSRIYAGMFLSLISFCILNRSARAEVLFSIATAIFCLSRFDPSFDLANNRNVPFYPVAIFSLWGVLKRWNFAALSPPLFPRICSIALALAALWGFAFRPLLEERISNRDSTAEFFNLHLAPGSYYWIGPLNLRPQYFIEEAAPASRYPFFLPWLAASESIVDEMIDDFERRKPPLIALSSSLSVWGNPFWRYGRPISNYVAKHYRRLPRSVLPGPLAVWRRKAD